MVLMNVSVSLGLSDGPLQLAMIKELLEQVVLWVRLVLIPDEVLHNLVSVATLVAVVG